MSRTRTLGCWTLTAVVAAGALSACGSGPETADGEQCDLNVGVLPFAELAPFYIAEEKNLFAEHGVDVEAHQASTGATLITSLISGDTPIIYSNYVSVLTAADKGLPIRVFRENDRPGAQGLYVLPDSGIKDASGFAGKKIAVNGLGNIMEVTTRAVLDDHGVDLDTVDFVEIPPPNMQAALEAGQVDAVWLVEPFVTLATQALRARLAVSAFEGSTEEMPVAGWATSAQYLASNPQCVAGFKAAMDEAMEIASSDPKAVTEIIPRYSQIPAEVATSLSEISFATDSDLSGLEVVRDLLEKYGVTEDLSKLDEVIVDESELGPNG